MTRTEELWLAGGGVREVYRDEYVEQLEKLVRLQHEALKQYYSDFKLGGEAIAAFERFDKGGE